jgi:hypothetical protein
MNEINLTEILHSRMNILFVALNPPEKSNSNGHYFSGSLSFWNLLFNSGLITNRVKSPLTGDDEVFRNNIINFKSAVFGITDLCHDILETKSSKVKVSSERVERIVQLVSKSDVKNLCLIHGKVGRAFKYLPSLDRSSKYGLIGKLDKINVFEMPFHNASIPKKHLEYKKLLTYI